MTYNVRCQIDGWPLGVSEQEKVILAETVREIIEKAGPLPMHAIVNYVTHLPNNKWPSQGTFLDYTYATIERACRAANLEPVWRIHNEEGA